MIGAEKQVQARVMAIIQARMSSTRLPGKVLLPLLGQPMLNHVVQRVQRASTIDRVIVATSTEETDQAIVDLCAQEGWPVYRGSLDDVLERYYQAALVNQAEVVVRITSDCPLIEPTIIDQLVGRFLEVGCLDYLSNTISPRTFPRGLDAEVMTFDALQRAWQEDQNPAWREHVTPYLYQHPELFRCAVVTNEEDLSSLRWTVDTPEDFALVERIYESFGKNDFSWQEVLALLDQHPGWSETNYHIEQKTV